MSTLKNPVRRLVTPLLIVVAVVVLMMSTGIGLT
jgi:hypothetical protein